MTRPSLATFAEAHGITVEPLLTDLLDSERDEWGKDPGATHWKVKVRKDWGVFTMRFHMGSAFKRPPNVTEVLGALATDGVGYANAKDFEDWANEYGYNPDSRKAERIYRQVGDNATKARQTFGDAIYEALLWDTEQE
jgi:hypothetical protein